MKKYKVSLIFEEDNWPWTYIVEAENFQEALKEASKQTEIFRNEVFLKILSVKHSKAVYQSTVIMQGVTFLMKFNAWVVRLPKKKKPYSRKDFQCYIHF